MRSVDIASLAVNRIASIGLADWEDDYMLFRENDEGCSLRVELTQNELELMTIENGEQINSFDFSVGYTEDDAVDEVVEYLMEVFDF